jgi:hypothetical protein
MALLALVLAAAGVLLIIAGVRGDVPALWAAIKSSASGKSGAAAGAVRRLGV